MRCPYCKSKASITAAFFPLWGNKYKCPQCGAIGKLDTAMGYVSLIIGLSIYYVGTYFLIQYELLAGISAHLSSAVVAIIFVGLFDYYALKIRPYG